MNKISVFKRFFFIFVPSKIQVKICLFENIQNFGQNLFENLLAQMDPTEAEVVFAQKLACGESRIRQKALYRLQKWIRSRLHQNQGKTKVKFDFFSFD